MPVITMGALATQAQATPRLADDQETKWTSGAEAGPLREDSNIAGKLCSPCDRVESTGSVAAKDIFLTELRPQAPRRQTYHLREPERT